ncbi:putative signal-transduction protein with CBS domains [Sulfolobus islandicus Y.G.57.14]|jgi:CBS domain-containing protein|uniref:CBS domain protein n=10 Tax=Saccharolobus islandicus TaxID=43080 RepID=M9UH12_SACIS|nr:CBS domain-containing protein [Sulfolobus islandicus]ACP36340.1 CBS domain containing protein [Sulfolobus islandicus L.S.2.15]ACP38932.1 putative signal-transduction protein with CBS domains [Sulfolobus islandicus M.14.25]ACP46572.1 putative signal-transduction protein with CBS domains [Sulfolobus islandicus Y.G.57.14]ACP47723.1 putative signal-transduction protein with CBS domains [Sulfolobus islandicus Y.N.15.51]ACP56136.1 putative signal-transduction protein with CBS domains [Sulfolobus 
MYVADLIVRNPVTAKAEISIRDAAKIMKKENLGSLIIVDETNRPIGIVTERDILRAVADEILLDSPVSTIMTKGLITIAPNKDITEALIIMYQNNVRHLAVVGQNGELVGVISIRDAAKAVNLLALDLAIW